MEIKRISDYQVRFILDRQDLEERNIRLNELSYGSADARELFSELMQLAREELDLAPEDRSRPMMVEAMPTRERGLTVTVSVVDNSRELDPRFSRFSRGDGFDDGSGPDGAYPNDGDEEMPGGPGTDFPGGPGSAFSGEADGDFSGGPGDVFPGGPGEDYPGGPGGADNLRDVTDPVPDGIQIQQGPELRAEINIHNSSSLNPNDIMQVLDGIMNGLAGKLGVRGPDGKGPESKGPESGGNKPGMPDKPGKAEDPARKGKTGPSPKDKAKDEGGALFQFSDLQGVIRAAAMIHPHYDGENTLYKHTGIGKYYLYIGSEHCTEEEFGKALELLGEFGTRCRVTYPTKEFFEEHTEKILEDAVSKLALLSELPEEAAKTPGKNEKKKPDGQAVKPRRKRASSKPAGETPDTPEQGKGGE